MMFRREQSGYSADVSLDLILDGRSIPLAQIGRDWIVLRKPTDLEPGPGEVVATIDGIERRWSVELNEGSHTATAKVAIRDLPERHKTPTGV